MLTENNSFEAKKLGVPTAIYLAFQKNKTKISELKKLVTETASEDIARPNSFLLTKYTKKINIDSETGRDVDFGIPYFYKSELLHGTYKKYAIAKIFRGLTGTRCFYEQLEIDKLSQKSISAVAKFLQEELSKVIAHAQLRSAFDLLDPFHAKDLMRGVFYVKSGVKHIEDLRGLRFLSIREVVLPIGVTVIRSFAFESVPLDTVIIPKTVSKIEERAFFGCGLKSIMLPKNKYLKSLGTKAFAKNNIETLFIPENFTVFDFNWFEDNPLREIDTQKNLRIYNQNPGVRINSPQIQKE